MGRGSGYLAALLLIVAASAMPTTASSQTEADIGPTLSRLGVTLDERPVKSESVLCRSSRQKGYPTIEDCRKDARKYIDRVFSTYIPIFKSRAEKAAAQARKADRDVATYLWDFSIQEEELAKIVGPDSGGFLSDSSLKYDLIEVHQAAVDPFLAPIAEKVEERIISEYDQSGLSIESLKEADAQCAPFLTQVCMANCPKRPLDNLKPSVRKRLKETCAAKRSEVPTKRCKAAAEEADPDGAYDKQRFAFHAGKGKTEDFNFARFVCSAGMEGVQVRLRESGLIFKKRWLEFGSVGEGDTFATAPLETVKNKDGVEFEVVKAIEGNPAPFSGPEDFIPCLNVNAGSSEMRMIKDAVVGGILAGLGQEEAGASIFDAFFMAAKVDKCRSDIRKFASQQ